MKANRNPSEFISVKGIEYFNFEEDFVEENVRCIPMIVRFKMDAAGIKLKLNEWSKFLPSERVQLAVLPIGNVSETDYYHRYLIALIAKYTNHIATKMVVEAAPDWADLSHIPAILQLKALEIEVCISLKQWQKLTDIQRFALLKLCRPGHENKNFSKAMLEFGLKQN